MNGKCQHGYGEGFAYCLSNYLLKFFGRSCFFAFYSIYFYNRQTDNKICRS